MELNEYQKRASMTAIYDDKHKVIYPALGLGNEAGEVLGKIKKWIRGDDSANGAMSDDRRESIKGELGDVLWYLAVLARDLDLELGDIAQSNIDKLQSRQERGALRGDGDKR